MFCVTKIKKEIIMFHSCVCVCMTHAGPLLYQCTAVFESGPGSRDDEEEEEAGSSVVINKGDIVKVLEKKDHGIETKK